MTATAAKFYWIAFVCNFLKTQSVLSELYMLPVAACHPVFFFCEVFFSHYNELCVPGMSAKTMNLHCVNTVEPVSFLSKQSCFPEKELTNKLQWIQWLSAFNSENSLIYKWKKLIYKSGCIYIKHFFSCIIFQEYFCGTLRTNAAPAIFLLGLDQFCRNIGCFLFFLLYCLIK